MPIGHPVARTYAQAVHYSRSPKNNLPLDCRYHAGSTAPRFMIALGSSARLIARMAASLAGSE